MDIVLGDDYREIEKQIGLIEDYFNGTASVALKVVLGLLFNTERKSCEMIIFCLIGETYTDNLHTIGNDGAITS